MTNQIGDMDVCYGVQFGFSLFYTLKLFFLFVRLFCIEFLEYYSNYMISVTGAIMYKIN
jgi:hypothetical protein